MAGGGFNIDDYVTVAERIGQFYAQYPDGSLQAEVIEISESRAVFTPEKIRRAFDFLKKMTKTVNEIFLCFPII